jgi:SAM-dependent methyltransferase
VSCAAQTETIQVRRLDDSQLANFDKDYVGDEKWAALRACIDRDLPDGSFSFLDIGGGNGLFADKVLAAYPQSRGTVLDNAAILLRKNKDWEDRKTIVCGSAENLETLFGAERFDIIFMNWVLHHLVGDSYTCTTENVRHLLHMSASILRQHGRISIFEHMYDGLVIDNLPSHIIYHLTSSMRLSSLMRRWGANTAGVGVCFRSRKAWLEIIRDAGLEVVEYAEGPRWPEPLRQILLLHLGHVRGGHFWIGKPAASV